MSLTVLLERFREYAVFMDMNDSAKIKKIWLTALIKPPGVLRSRKRSELRKDFEKKGVCFHKRDFDTG